MKQIEKTNTATYKVWQAVDGTEFKVEEECKKYEATALCIVRAKVKKLIVTDEHNAWDVMGGYEDNNVFGVRVSSEEDADIIKQSILLDCAYLQKDEYKDRKEKIFAKVDSAIGDIFLVGINCEGEWYAINSRKNIISNLNSLDKKKDA